MTDTVEKLLVGVSLLLSGTMVLGLLSYLVR